MRSATHSLHGVGLGLAVSVAFAVGVAAQSPEPLPDWLDPDLPLGVEKLCGGPVVRDLPVGEAWYAVSASTELPPLPAWCDGTCVIDVAFYYAPEAIGKTQGDDPEGEPRGPQSLGDLRRLIEAAVRVANVVFRRAGLDAELRFVGLEQERGLSGMGMARSVAYVEERLPHARANYGADLVYAIGDYPGGDEACGGAGLRAAGMSSQAAAMLAAFGAVPVGCGGHEIHSQELGRILIHEVGHNLGLEHQPEIAVYAPFVPFGHGYVGTSRIGQQRYGSIMAYAPQVHFLSTTDELVNGRVLGAPDVSDSTRALRYTIPDATRYSPTVVPEEGDDPHGFGCRPSNDRACVNQHRFEIRANYSPPTASRQTAKRLDTLGIGDSATLFSFGEPKGPDILVKVVNGCATNGHWWVFGGPASDLAFGIAVNDLAGVGGVGVIEYRHKGGGVIVGTNGYSTGAGVIVDIGAFPCGEWEGGGAASLRETHYGGDYGDRAGRLGDLADVPYDQTADSEAVFVDQGTGEARDYACWHRDKASCLNNWRFEVRTLVVRDQIGAGEWVQPLETYGLGDSASLFHFFGSEPEMLIKMVNGCAINGYWWVFGSAASELIYDLRIYDYATARRNPEGRIEGVRQYGWSHLGDGHIVGRDGQYSTRAGVIADTRSIPCNPNIVGVSVSFGSSSHEVPEGGSVQVELYLSDDPGRDVVIPLIRRHVGGTTDADYTGVPESVTFSIGETGQMFEFQATEDSDQDHGESVVVAFGDLPSGVFGADSTTISIVDDDSPPPPWFEPGTSVPDQRWEEGAVIEPLVLPAASGGEGELTYSLSPSPPEGVTFDPSSRNLSGRPTAVSGPVEHTYTVTDAIGASASLSFMIEVVVAPPRFEPGTAVPDQRWEEGAFIEPLALPAASGGEGELTHSLSPQPPEGVLFDALSLTLSGRPTTASDGTEYTYTATDALGGTASLSFSIEVAEAEGNCRSSSSAMCFQDARYEVTVDWWTADGQSGAGEIASVGTSDSVLFWFFSATNWELLVKVLDGCAVNGHQWVFGAATTDVGYRVRVADTESGSVREYRNEPGRAARAITDVTAFWEACAATGATTAGRTSEPRELREPREPREPHELRELRDPDGPPGSVEALGSLAGLQTAAPILALQDGRFEVGVRWTTEGGETGPGSAAPERTVDSGLFWFFEPSNWEMLVKVLDGCALNEHYWVLAGSATTLGFEIAVTDTEAGAVRRYVKTDRREPAAAFVDVSAFPCSR